MSKRTHNTFSEPKQTLCGETRREFLWEKGGGFLATALTGLLAEEGFFAAPALAETNRHVPSLAPKKPHFAPKAKNVIFIFNYGGVSQVDTFDPKPELTRWHDKPIPFLDKDPALKSRSPGALLRSTRTWKRYGQSGIEVSDLFPKVAQHVDEMAIIRGAYADSFAHGSGLIQMNTGFLRQGYPSLGSWAAYGLGTENQNLPGFVVLLDHRGGPIGGPPNWSSGFMPAAYQGTQFRPQGEPILNLTPAEGVSAEQQKQQIALLRQLHELRGSAKPDNYELMARIQSYELAFRMQSHAPEAVDLAKETEETKRLYGLDQAVTEKFGKRCLIARRLVERGVRFVQVYSGGGHNDDSWDAHGDVDGNHELHCKETDQPIHALLTDLKRKGMLDQTLVIWAGEFGRTPTSQNGKGRDHNPRGFTVWMAGGGVKGGQVFGQTDEFGYAAVGTDKAHVHDIHATILHLLGFDHRMLTYFHAGRNMRLTDVFGNVIKPLIA